MKTDEELKVIFLNNGIPEDELDEMIDAYRDHNTSRHSEAHEIVNNG